MFDIQQALIPVFITATLLTAFFIFFLFATLARLKSKKTKKEHDYLKAVNEATERAMTAVSIEIHNNVNQILSLILSTMTMIDRHAVPAQKKYIADTERMLREVIGDLRAISHLLNSNHLKRQGLLDSLNEECRHLNNLQSPSCRLEVEGVPRSFSKETELILIRIAQEGIQNVLKHAGAQNLTLSLDYSETLFSMTIEDDGIGFNKESAVSQKSMGLQSIRNQSRIIEGCKIGIHSTVGEGTRLLLTIHKPVYLAIEKIEVGNATKRDTGISL